MGQRCVRAEARPASAPGLVVSDLVRSRGRAEWSARLAHAALWRRLAPALSVLEHHPSARAQSHPPPHAVRGAAEEQSSPGDGQSAVYVYRRVAVDAKNAAQEQRGYRGQRAGDGEHNPAEHPPEYARAEPSRQAGAGETLAMSRSDVERVETRRPARFRTAPFAWEGAAAYDALGAAARA